MGGTLVTSTQPAGKSGFARVWRTLKQLFHELVAGIFAVLAVAWLQSALRAWARDVAHWLVFAALGVAIVLGAFAWTSFRRSRQVN
jgi:hypothetical protein